MENEEDIKEFSDYVPPVIEEPEPVQQAPPPSPKALPPPKQAPPTPSSPSPVPQTVAPLVATSPTPAVANVPKTGRVFATPYARKIAKEKGIDISVSKTTVGLPYLCFKKDLY